MSKFGSIAPSSAFKIRNDDENAEIHSTKKKSAKGLAMKHRVESTPVKGLFGVATPHTNRRALGDLSHAKLNTRQSLIPPSGQRTSSKNKIAASAVKSRIVFEEVETKVPTSSVKLTQKSKKGLLKQDPRLDTNLNVGFGTNKGSNNDKNVDVKLKQNVNINTNVNVNVNELDVDVDVDEILCSRMGKGDVDAFDQIVEKVATLKKDKQNMKQKFQAEGEENVNLGFSDYFHDAHYADTFSDDVDVFQSSEDLLLDIPYDHTDDLF